MRLECEKMPAEAGEVGGFSLTELLFASAMLAVLAVLLVPALSTANDTSKAAVCLANMHQWGIAISMYSEEYNDYFPHKAVGTPVSSSPHAWYNTVPKYVNSPSLITLYAQGNPPTSKTKSIYSCPSATNCPANPTDANPYYMYGLNNRIDPNGPALYKRSQCTAPAQTLLFCENEGTFSGTTGKYCPARHSGGSNFAFVDGHAEWIAFQDFCRLGNPGCTNTIMDGDSSGLTGDWRRGVKYHWYPFINTPI
jgi:prepilin-type processing-associated H-X9-DG protein